MTMSYIWAKACLWPRSECDGWVRWVLPFVSLVFDWSWWVGQQPGQTWPSQPGQNCGHKYTLLKHNNRNYFRILDDTQEREEFLTFDHESWTFCSHSIAKLHFTVLDPGEGYESCCFKVVWWSRPKSANCCSMSSKFNLKFAGEFTILKPGAR